MFGQQSQQNQGLFGSTPFGQQSSSLFGQPQQQPTSLFGGTTTTGLGTTTGTTGGGLFGSTTPQQNTGLFGSNTTGQGLFGQTATTPTSPFGQQTSPFGQQQQQTSLFGGTQNTGGLFGTTPSFGTQGTTSGLFSTPTKTNAFGSPIGVGAYGTAGVTFREQVDTTVGGKVQSILAMKEIADRNKTLEQLRFEDYTQQANPQQQSSPFGQSTTNTGGGLFGTSTTGGGLFGAQQKPAGTGLFGTTTTTGTGSLFGSSPTTTQQTGGLFGSSPQQSGGLFGSSTTTPTTGLFGASTTTPASTGGGLFGNTTTSGGLFGSKPTTGGGLFGSTTPATGGGLFGNTSTSGGGLFGSGTNTTTGGLFGSTTTPASTGGGLFGNTANTGGSLFGNTTSPTTTGGGLFGNTTTSNTGGGGLFGNTSTGTTSGGLFGSKPATGGGLFGTSTGTGGLFGNTSQTNTAAGTGGGLFGSTTTTQPTTTGGLFGTSTTTQPSTTGGLFGSKPATTGGGLFGTSNTGGLFSNTGTSGGGGLFGTTTSPTTATGGLFGNSGTTNTTGGGLFGNQTSKTGGGLFGSPGGGGGGLFGTTTTTSPLPNANAFQQQSPSPFVNPNAPLLNATITDTYHLSRLAIGNAAKLIWGNTYTIPSATRARPSLRGESELTSSSWKPVPRVSYIDTVSATARTPRASTVGRASSITRGERDTSLSRRDGSLSRRDVFESARDLSRDGAKTSTGAEERPKLALTATEAATGGQTQRASEPISQRHPSRSYMEPSGDLTAAPSSTRHFEPLPLETSSARDESPEHITPWIPATSETLGRRHSQGATPCLTPRRTARDGFTSARRSPNSFRVPNDLAPKTSNPEIECRPTIKALRRFTEAELCQVADFEVIHATYGSIMWPGYTDVRGLDIDTTVDIQDKAVEVYGQKWHQQQQEIYGPDANIQEPPEGEGLNKEAIITLYNCKPILEDGVSLEEAYATHKESLKEYTKKMDAEFISLTPDWTWKFKVAHFSRYAMPMSSRSAVAPGSPQSGEGS